MTNQLNCICLDDELPALKLLETYCKHCNEINLLATFSDAEKALEFIKNNEKSKIDLAIMDIQMPKINGIDFFKQINEDILGIFISANPNFAVDAYDIDIVDFILKPASFERFEKGIKKASDFLKIKNTEPENSIQNYITIKQDYISKKIKISEINYVEGAGEYIKIITDEKNYLIFQRLKDFEEQYAKNGFIRIHKSYLVLKENIKNVTFNEVTLKNTLKLPLGRVYRNEIKIF
jgi:two-component system, LytTR family, response regulator LytT